MIISSGSRIKSVENLNWFSNWRPFESQIPKCFDESDFRYQRLDFENQYCFDCFSLLWTVYVFKLTLYTIFLWQCRSDEYWAGETSSVPGVTKSHWQYHTLNLVSPYTRFLLIRLISCARNKTVIKLN